MIKTLFLVTDLSVANGLTTFAMSYLRTMNHEKMRVDFALYHGTQSPYTQEIEKYGGKIFVLPSVKKINQHIRFCKEILEKEQYQIIHDNVQVISVPFMYLAKKQGVSVRILHAHSTRMSEYSIKKIRNRLLFPLLLAQSNVCFACGRKAGKAMYGKKPFIVVPNTISPEDVEYSSFTREKTRKAEAVGGLIVIATVGRATPCKNPIFALNVIKTLKDQGQPVVYWWIGGGPMEEEMRRYIHSNGMEDYVKLLGSRQDMKELYQAADLFFLPSVFEGLPLTGIEAQAYGLPCIVSDSVTKEFVFTDLVRFVNLNAATDAWTDAIHEQMTRISERRSHRNDLMKSQFTSEKAGERLTAIYEKLLKGEKGIV